MNDGRCARKCGEHWQQLPAEERQRFRQERQERREAFQQMPPEDRSRLRDELRGQRNGGGGLISSIAVAVDTDFLLPAFTPSLIATLNQHLLMT